MSAQIATAVNSVLKTGYLLQMVLATRVTIVKVALFYLTLLMKVTAMSAHLVTTVRRAPPHHLPVRQELSTTKRKANDPKIVNLALVVRTAEGMLTNYRTTIALPDTTAHVVPTHLDPQNTKTCLITVATNIRALSTLSIKPVIFALTARIVLWALLTQSPATEESIVTLKDWKALSGIVLLVIIAVMARYQRNQESARVVTTVRKELPLKGLVRLEHSTRMKGSIVWNTASTALPATIVPILDTLIRLSVVYKVTIARLAHGRMTQVNVRKVSTVRLELVPRSHVQLVSSK